MASSKPVATAIVGAGGIAVARPIATAIAGISPGEVSGLGLSIPHKQAIGSISEIRLMSKYTNKYGLTQAGRNDDQMILVGPGYFQQTSEHGNAVDESRLKNLNFLNQPILSNGIRMKKILTRNKC